MSLLPFHKQGTVHEDGQDDETINLAIWPAIGVPSRTNVGARYDWYGEADIAAAPRLVGRTNVAVTVEGRRLRLVAAFQHDYVPHVEIFLAELTHG